MELDSKPLLSGVELQIHTVLLRRFNATYITTLSRLILFNWRISTVTIILLLLFMKISNPPQWKFNFKLPEWPFNPDITARIRRAGNKGLKNFKTFGFVSKSVILPEITLQIFELVPGACTEYLCCLAPRSTTWYHSNCCLHPEV